MLRVLSCHGISVRQAVTEGVGPSEVIYVVFRKAYVETSISHEKGEQNSISGRYSVFACQ